MLKTVIWLTVYICIGAIFYYSWLPNPDFSNEFYMPSRLVIWTNEYGNLRTAVPFIFLGFSLNAMFSYKNSIEITLSKAMIFKLFIKITFICSLLVFIVELGQFFLPKRSPDIEDILWGIIGSQIGFAFHVLLIKCHSYFINYAK